MEKLELTRQNLEKVAEILSERSNISGIVEGEADHRELISSLSYIDKLSDDLPVFCGVLDQYYNQREEYEEENPHMLTDPLLDVIDEYLNKFKSNDGKYRAYNYVINREQNDISANPRKKDIDEGFYNSDCIYEIEDYAHDLERAKADFEKRYKFSEIYEENKSRASVYYYTLAKEEYIIINNDSVDFDGADTLDNSTAPNDWFAIKDPDVVGDLIQSEHPEDLLKFIEGNNDLDYVELKINGNYTNGYYLSDEEDRELLIQVLKDL